MSCTMYLVCKSHDPWLESGEVGHNKSYLKQIRADIDNRDEIVELMDKSMEITGDIPDGSVPQRSTWRFLWFHRNCDLGIIDEYRHEYPIVVMEDDDTNYIPPKTMLGKVKRVTEDSNGVTIEFDSLTEEGRRIFNL